MSIETKDDGTMRSFSTGATRDTGEGKLDFEGFLHPLFLEQFAKYMNMHRLQSDGQLRDSDNWQKGIPQDVCMKSMFRHFFEVWKAHRVGIHCRRSYHDLMAGAMGMMFNIQAYVLHDLQNEDKGMVDFDGDEPTDEMKERQEKISAEKHMEDFNEEYVCNMTPEELLLARGEEPDTGRIYGFVIPTTENPTRSGSVKNVLK